MTAGAGATAEPVTDGGAAPEAERSLFSRAEFMADEPEEPPRKRRDEAPTFSLLEWALDKEHEGALAAAG